MEIISSPYFIIFTLSLVFSLLINWLLISYTQNKNPKNKTSNEEIRWQSYKPAIGGISFYLVLLLTYFILSAILKIDFSSDNKAINSLLITATVGFLIGSIDDARNTNPLLKLLSQIGCGILMALLGNTIEISPNYIWNGIATVFWVVFLMNSINLLDNMDGLASIISLYIIFGIFAFSYPTSSVYLLFLVSIMAAIFGFLYFNWSPSKIYMGDSGSMTLGVILAHASIYLLWNQRLSDSGYFQLHQFFLPLVYFTIPIFDTTTVFLHRILRRQSPFVGGRDHLSHHFVYHGLNDSQAVFLLGLINYFCIIMGLMVFYFYPPLIPLFFVIWVLGFIVIQYVYLTAPNKQF